MSKTTLTETELDNILVRQKDRILDLLNRDPLAAIRALEVVAELWRELGYEYKTREILALVSGPACVDGHLRRIYAPR